MKKFTSTTVPVTLIWLYWLLIPMSVRKRLSNSPGTSVPAYRAIQNGGGWAVFWRCALPRVNFRGGFTAAWFVGPDGVGSGTHTKLADWVYHK